MKLHSSEQYTEQPSFFFTIWSDIVAFLNNIVAVLVFRHTNTRFKIHLRTLNICLDRFFFFFLRTNHWSQFLLSSRTWSVFLFFKEVSDNTSYIKSPSHHSVSFLSFFFAVHFFMLCSFLNAWL